MRFEILLSHISVLLYAVTLSYCKSQALSDFLSNEDDDILNEIIPVKIKRNSVHGNTVAKRRSGEASFQQIASNAGKTNPQQKMKDITSSILGDVNKYGLWEYTADNTGMGDQIKNLMNSDQNSDANGEKTSHSLEKQASKMNEQINKYVESNIDSSSPTIDPLETPEGYTPTQRPLSFKGVDSNAVEQTPSSSDVVTIPNSIQIEDEHGNLLDTVKPEKPVSRNRPTTAPIMPALSPTQLVRHAVHPTSSTINRFSPTPSLTERLLKALKSSSSFRMNAQKLLASDSDTEDEVKIKQDKLSTYLKAYEQSIATQEKIDNSMISNSLSKLKENVKNTDQNKAKESLDQSRQISEGKDDGKLLTMIKHLMKDESSINTNQIQKLLSSLKKNDDNRNDNGDVKLANENTLNKNTKTGKEGAKHVHTINSNKKQSDHIDTLDDIKIEPQHHAPKSDKKDDPATSQHHKDGFLSEYTSTEDLDHPLGTEATESPLLGYLEQESAALSDIKVDTISPDIEQNDKLEQMMKNHNEDQDTRKDQDKMIYAQLKQLLKSPHKENPFSPEKIKALGKQIESNSIDDSSRLNNDNDGEQRDVDKIVNKDTAMINKHNSSKNILSEFRKFLQMYHNEEKPSSPDLLSSSRDDETSDEVHHSEATNSKSNSIEDQLKEIQKQKEMLKNREEKLKELSHKTPMEIAKQNSAKITQLAEPVDHMLDLATPQLKNKSTSLDDLPAIPAPGKNIYPSNDLHPELIQHIVTSEPDNSISVTSQFKQPATDNTQEENDLLNEGDIEPEDINQLKQVIGDSLKNHLLGDVLHKNKVMSFKSTSDHLTKNSETVQKANETKSEDDSISLETKSKGKDKAEGFKIDSSIKAALNRAGITDNEINSKFNSADTSEDVNNMIKELRKNMTTDMKTKRENETEPATDDFVNKTASESNTSSNASAIDNVTLDNSTSSNSNTTKLHKKVSDDRPGLPINNPKPKADEGYTPHANFHTSFHTRPSVEISHKNSLLPQHSSFRQGRPLQSHTPHLSQQILLNTQNQNVAPPIHIKHFHRKAPSLMNQQVTNALLPPAGMGRPKIKSAYGHVTDIMEPVEPPLISYKTNSNHHAVINSIQPLFKTMPTMFHAFLKHKIMPAIDEFSITGDKKSLNFENKLPVSEQTVARIIKPQSALNNRFIDVAASKKSFGKLPNKPKTYLIKELRHKLKILTLKRHIEKQLLKKFRHRLKNLTNADQQENHTLFANKKNKQKLNENISKNVLIPKSSSSNSGTLIRQETESNVIVPGSRYNSEYTSLFDDNKKDKNISENDVTRSQLPKAKNLTGKVKEATIEEVFNIIGSDDEISEKSEIPSYKNKRSRVNHPILHKHL